VFFSPHFIKKYLSLNSASLLHLSMHCATMAFDQASKRSDLCALFEGKHRMAIHFEDLFVASPVIAQEAAGRLKKVVYSEND
jgi:hypothetical protein